MYTSRSIAFAAPDKGDRFGGGSKLCAVLSSLVYSNSVNDHSEMTWCNDRFRATGTYVEDTRAPTYDGDTNDWGSGSGVGYVGTHPV